MENETTKSYKTSLLQGKEREREREAEGALMNIRGQFIFVC